MARDPRSAFRKKMSQYRPRQPRTEVIAGRPDGTVFVPGTKKRMIYVRRHKNAIPFPVWNKLANPTPGIRLIIGETEFDPGLIQVVDVPIAQGGDVTPGTSVANHGQSHFRGGDDPIFLALRQIYDGLVAPESGFEVRILPTYALTADGSRIFRIEDQKVDLSSFVPTDPAQGRYVLVAAEDTGQVVLHAGDEVDFIDLNLMSLPPVPEGEVPLCYVRLYTGMSRLQDSTGNSDFLDPRYIMRTLGSTGSGGGASSFLDLIDTPSSYIGNTHAFVMVGDSGSQLVFDKPFGDLTTIFRTNLDYQIESLDEKTSLDDDDAFLIEDSEDDYSKKRVLAKNLPSGGGGGGASAFTDLTDTFNDYSGLGGNPLIVGDAEDGIEAKPISELVRAAYQHGYRAAFRADLSAGKALANNDYVKVDNFTEVFDTGGFYDAASCKWTPPEGLAVIYVQLDTVNTNANGVDICLYKNGSLIKRSRSRLSAANAHNAIFLTFVDHCNGSDYYEIYGWRWDGSAAFGGNTEYSWWQGFVLPEEAAVQVGLVGGKALISEIIPDDTGTVTFSDFEDDWLSIEIEVVGRSTRAANNDDALRIAINGDTTDANYRRGLINGYGTTVARSQADDRNIGYFPAASAPANSAGSFTVKLNDLGSGFKKQITSIGSYRFDNNSLYEVQMFHALEWQGTDPITSVTIELADGKFESGTRIRLWANSDVSRVLDPNVAMRIFMSQSFS